MHAGHIVALLVRTQIHGKIDKISPDTTVVQERHPFCRRAVSRNRLSRPFGRNEKIEQFALSLLGLFAKREICLEPAKTCRFLASPHFSRPVASRFTAILYVGGI